MTESCKWILAGGGISTLSGLGAAWYYDEAYKTSLDWQCYDRATGRTWDTTAVVNPSTTTTSCSKVVKVPFFGTAHSRDEASTTGGVFIGLLVFGVAAVVFLYTMWRKDTAQGA
jgi:hypothetical protein